MSFSVEPDALVKFSKFLEEYGEDANAVKKFFEKKTDMDTHAQGVLNALFGQHEDHVRDMSERTSLMSSIGSNSAETVLEVAEYYRDQDKSNEAKIDETYDGSSYDSTRNELDEPLAGSDKEFVNGVYSDFKYSSAKSELTIEKSVSDLEPKGSDIEDWTRKVVDRISPTWWLRAGLKFVCGISQDDKDVVDSLIEWWGGEWRAWARCGLAWQACYKAVYHMHGEIEHIDITLEQVWEGKAASEAIAYFLGLADATLTEGDAFEALYELYMWQMEYCYELWQTINDLLNTLIDIIFDLVITAAYNLPGAVVAAINIISKIGTCLTVGMNVIQMVETQIAYADVPEVPPTDLEHLNRTLTGTNGYHHPKDY